MAISENKTNHTAVGNIDSFSAIRKDKIDKCFYYPPPGTLHLDDTTDEKNATCGYVGGTALSHPITSGNTTVWGMNDYNAFMDDSEAPPTVNPVLWRMERLNNKNGLFQVHPKAEKGGRTGNIYQIRSYDLATMTIVKGDTGWVVIDPLTSNETAAAGWKCFCEQVDANALISAIIITHSHVDHYKGVEGIIDATGILRGVAQADFETKRGIPAGKVLVVAPNGFYNEAISENLYLGNCMSRRAVYMYGSALPKDEKGHVGSGLGKTISTGTGALLSPSFEVKPGDKELVTLYIDGLEMQFQDVPGTEAPAEFHVYIKKYRALCPGENVTHTLHNLLTSRGAKVRDPKAFGKAIDDAIRLFGNMECLIGNHHWPTWGNAECIALMEKQRDLYLYFNDQVIRLLNKGMNMEEIAETFTLPDSLNCEFYNRGYYGTVNHDVKAVVQRYIGWWDGNPANYFKYPDKEVALRFVADMGGADAVLRKAMEYFKKADYRWTVELTRQVVFNDPENMQARYLQADALEQLAYSFESGTWRNIFLSAAFELRGEPMGVLPRTNKEFITQATATLKTLTPEYIFEYFATLVNGVEAGKANLLLYVHFDDTNQTHELHLVNGVLHHKDKTEDKELAEKNVITFAGVEAFAEDFRLRMLTLHPNDCPGTKTDGGASLTSLYQFFDTFNGMWNIVEPLDSTPRKRTYLLSGFVTGTTIQWDISASACYDSITHIYDDTGKSYACAIKKKTGNDNLITLAQGQALFMGKDLYIDISSSLAHRIDVKIDTWTTVGPKGVLLHKSIYMEDSTDNDYNDVCITLTGGCGI